VHIRQGRRAFDECQATIGLAEEDHRTLDRLTPGRDDLPLDNSTAGAGARRLVAPGFGDADYETQ
jgi:hypothetical protein